MGGGGGSKSTTTVQKSDPWEGQQPFLTGANGSPIYETVANPNYTEGAKQRSWGGGGGINYGGGNSQPQYTKKIIGYTGGTPGVFPEASRIYQEGLARGGYTPNLADQTQEALGYTEDLARNNVALNDAVGFNQDVVNGDYMMGGDQFMSAYGNDIQDSINAQFARSGRTNSGYHSNTVAEGLYDASARQFNNDVQNRQRASALAPGLTQAQYGDFDRLANVGGVYEGLDEAQFNADINNQWNQLGNYNNIIQGHYGGTNTTQQPTTGGSKFGNVLGGGLAGASLGPWGAAAGALGGLLF